LRFLYDGSYEEFRKKLTERRNSIPKYISRDVTPEDAERYQTIYAKEEELWHLLQDYFSKHLLKKLEIKGIKFAEVTLHVGLGTFNLLRLKICQSTKWTLRN
jgi:S-adenosylmethionine:tRNA ribosyltransferase-isomerase